MGGVHDGHRKRVKELFLEQGFSDKTPEHKVLEMLLFYTIPRRDTNELAHLLINTFGSLAGVFDASPERLMQVPGITFNTACLIKMILPISRQYILSREKGGYHITTREMAAKYLEQKFIGRTVETVFVLCMDNKGKVLDCPMISEGDEISVSVSARTVVEEVFKSKATVVAIAHNHPRGMALPSAADISVTRNISRALRNLNIQFLDHVIVVDNDYVSMAQSAEFSDMFT